MIARRFAIELSTLLLVALPITACAGGGDDGIAITGTPAPTTTAAPLTVSGDDFYTPPDPLPGDAHGDLIWAEAIDEWWGSPRRAWRVLYRSEAIDGRPIAVSGYVIAPPAGDGDGEPTRPVVAWAHETVGSGDQCAPSRTFDTVIRTDRPATVVAAQLSALVDAGSVVVASDYEGLGTPGPHPFLVGESEGRGVLDGVLAARDIEGLGAGDQLLVYGASQGGHAALWAGELAGSWAPDLDLVGVVAAAPFSEVELLLPAAAFLPGGEGYLALGVYGQIAANPALPAEAVLDAAAIENAGLVEDRCGQDVFLAFRALSVAAGRSLGRLEGFETPEWKAQLASIKPGRVPIGAPVLIVQGDRDLTVPARTTRALVERLCAVGDSVTTHSYGSAGHEDVVVFADPDLQTWIADRLAGRPVTSSCPPSR